MKSFGCAFLVSILAGSAGWAQISGENADDSGTANRPFLITPAYAQGLIRDLVFLADNRTLVTSDGRTTTFWDVDSGLIVYKMTGAAGARITPDKAYSWGHVMNPVVRATRVDVNDLHGPRVNVLIENPDLVLADALKSTLLFRNGRDGQVLLTPTPESAPASAKAEWLTIPSRKGFWRGAALNPLGRTAAVGSYDGSILVYDYVSHTTLFDIKPTDAAITDAAFSPNGELLATVSHPRGCFKGDPQNTSFTISGRTATCPAKSTITVRDATSGKQVYASTEDRTDTVAFSPDSLRLAIGMSDRFQVVVLATKATRNFPLTLDMNRVGRGEGRIVRIAFRPDDQMFAETSYGPVHLVDRASGRVVRSLADPPTSVMNDVLTGTGRLLTVVTKPSRIVVTELSPGASSRILKTNPATVGSPSVSGDGSTLLARGADKKIRVWSIDRAALQCALPETTPPADEWRARALTTDGSLAALPGAEHEGLGQEVELWDTRSCRLLETIVPAAPQTQAPVFALLNPSFEGRDRYLRRITRVAISGNGRFLSWVTRENVVHFWDLKQKRLVSTARIPVPAVFSERDEQTLKVTNRLRSNGAALALPPPGDAGDPLRFDQLSWGITGIDFSPDESTLATLDANGQVRLWSSETGSLKLTLGSISEEAVFVLDGRFRRPFGWSTFAFSPDGRFGLNGSLSINRPALWDIRTGKALHTFDGPSVFGSSAAFTSDGNTAVFGGQATSGLQFSDVSTGGILAFLRVYGDGSDWMVNTPDGLFDGTPAAYRQAGWGFPGKSRFAVPLEAFFSDYYHPGLIPEVLAGTRIRAKRDLAQLDRRQAKVQMEQLPAPEGASASMVRLRIRVTPPSDSTDRSDPVAIRDLRLFRNGSLVHLWRGQLKPGADGAVDVNASVRLTAGPNEFVAYAFNQDNVQSAKGTVVVDGAASLARAGTAYLLVAGVNQYENPQFNLKYAAADARMMAEELSGQLRQTGRYGDVKVISFLDADATKTKLLTALIQLSGGATAERSQIGPARPEDAVFIFFAGHGWARNGQFYLIPHDLGYRGPRAQLSSDAASQKAVLDHAISDSELGAAVENIDAGLIALIIDACNAGQLLESEESRQGPFNSKGLAQLAWDKGMFVLTAAQSYQAALEASELQHGYLTYALLEEGLKERKADRDPEDGRIDLKEWFDFASSRVPEMQRERSDRARLLVQGSAGAKSGTNSGASGLQAPRAFYRSELRSRFLVAGPMEAQAEDCSREPSLKSTGGGDPVSLEFRNATTSIRKVYWIDFVGNRQLHNTLAPGGVFTIDSYATHSWLVADASDQCMAVYSPAVGREVVAIRK